MRTSGMGVSPVPPYPKHTICSFPELLHGYCPDLIHSSQLYWKDHLSRCLGRRRSVCIAEPFLLEELEPRRLLAAPALAGLYHTFAPFSQPRESFATAKVGDDVLFAGGDFTDAKNNPLVSDAVDIYHATSGQWSAGASLRQPSSSSTLRATSPMR